MSTLLKNAMLCHLNPIQVEHGDLLIEGEKIAKIGDLGAIAAGEVIDCGGAVVLPGLVNGHTHLYSALAVGMPPPASPPTTFLEILERIWWKLDVALDAETVELSARVGAIDAARCGTTTLIDHHASPSYIPGSLDLIENGLRSVGLRGVLCYETTDRHGVAGRKQGLHENRRFIEKCRQSKDHRFAGLVGAHASFTLEDETLNQLTLLAAELDSGIHIHVAEDSCDERACRKQHGLPLMDRLARFGILNPRNLLAHCIHLDDTAIQRINDSQPSLAHNPRSNMNNAVGYAPLAKIDRVNVPVQLGTDGIGEDLFAEAHAAWLKSRDGVAGLAPVDVIEMLNASSRLATRLLGTPIGLLHPDAAADVVVTDYNPHTPCTTENFAGHFLFGMSSRFVKHVFVGGRAVLRDREIVSGEVNSALVQDAARRLWQRL
jgi:putative selenium metabolism protein SsnA